MNKTQLRFNRRTLARAGAGAAALLTAGPAWSRRARAQTGEVSFMTWDQIANTPMETAINAFQEASGTVVNVQPTPGSGSDYETKMRTLLASGAPPDVMRINDDFVRGYSLADQLLDLRPYIERDGLNPEDFNTHPFNFTVQPDGQHTAWTIGTQPAVIFYNRDLFEAAGVELPPTTWTGENWDWDRFLEAAMTLTKPDGEQYGALLVDDTASETIYPVNNGESTGIYSVDGTEFTLANPAGVEAMQWVADLTCVHKVQPTWGEVLPDDAGEQLFSRRPGGDDSADLWHIGLLPQQRDRLHLGRGASPRQGRISRPFPPSSTSASRRRRESRRSLAVAEVPRWPGGGHDLRRGRYLLPVHKEALALIVPGKARSPAHVKSSWKRRALDQRELQPAHPACPPDLRAGPRPALHLCSSQPMRSSPAVKEQVEQALAGEI